MTPKLNERKDTCTIGEITLKKGQSVDYKSAVERLISNGKIVDFIHPGNRQSDKSSVWMRIVDTVNKERSEWIAVSTWYEQNKRGIFKPLQTSKPKKNANREQEDDVDMPF